MFHIECDTSFRDWAGQAEKSVKIRSVPPLGPSSAGTLLTFEEGSIRC